MRQPLIQLTIVFVAVAVSIAPSRAGAHEAWGIVRDAQGRIYIRDIPANSIWRIARDGRVEAILRDTHAHALVVGPGGAIYGTNVPPAGVTRSVWRLDISGRSTMVIPPTRRFALDLQPFLIASDGTIYSTTPYEPTIAPAERRLFLLLRTARGVIDTVAGGLTGFADGNGTRARLSSIDGMAWLPDSSMLVVDGARLRRVTRGGAVISITGTLTDLKWDQDLMGASVAADGSIHVADFARRRVQHFSTKGVSIATSTGFYWSPTGVLWTPEGRYFLEHPRAPFGILGDLGI